MGASWFLEDGGKGMKPNAKVSETAPVAVDRANGEGFLNLTRPASVWPGGN